jgi:P27 family predicted phage terminase small subunit
MKGRKPKATSLKLIDGNPGKRPLNLREPVPLPLDTDTPAELTDPVAIAEWQETIVPAIVRRQITSAERTFAIAYCELWATWRSQIADASRHAHVVATGRDGKPTANPARRMANQTLMLLVKIGAELGLTPTSRSRVQAVEGHGQTQDRWSELLG